jgi:RNA polymerase sigma-70 factor (ECF subfamily)
VGSSTTRAASPRGSRWPRGARAPRTRRSCRWRKRRRSSSRSQAQATIRRRRADLAARAADPKVLSLEEEEALELPVAGAGDDPEAPRRRALVRALLDELPEAQAETLVLRVMLGYSIAEVAEAMGVPTNTVRSRLRLAKEAMRSRIVEDQAFAELLEVG